MENKIRCAVYTRKSTDEGLDKEFNTLEAQREAGENYIKSLKCQGWVMIPEHYDDGGFSGGNMKRPALQRLLKDVEAGLVDMIVVYKIDRLTRSLLDFAQLIQIFDKHNCSFVSVTQHFNTCDSMGKLTLNVLLSFAQFEREVSGERIRDKIAASKKKRMWMGGPVPLGYDVIKKKLVINPEEAEIVNFLFTEYARTQSERRVVERATELGYYAKSREVRDGLPVIKKLHKTMVNNILRNPVYIGKVRCHEELYDGLHEAIISQELWDKVQEIKKMNRNDKFLPSRSVKNSLLKGLIECECCGTMTPTRTKQGNKYYEYYTSVKAVKEGYAKCEVGSLPAAEVDNFIIDKVKEMFKNPEFMQELLAQLQKEADDINPRTVYDIANNIGEVFQYFEPATVHEFLAQLIQRVIIGKHSIKIKLLPLGALLLEERIITDQEHYNPQLLEFNYPIIFGRKRGRVKIVEPDAKQVNVPERDDKLFFAVAQAFKLKTVMDTKRVTINELATLMHYDRCYLGKLLRLTLLSPVIINSILNGTQPKMLRLENFTREKVPYLWSEQLKKFGYSTE